MFVKCNVFVAIYHRTTFCGFDSIQTFSTIDQQSQLSAGGKKRDVENTPKFTRLTVSLPHDPASCIRPVAPRSRPCSLEEQYFKCGIFWDYDAPQRRVSNSEAPVLAGGIPVFLRGSQFSGASELKEGAGEQI